MTSGQLSRTVAVVGAGAAGTMVAIQLCEAATRRRSRFELVLIDPAPEAGRGAAYATRDPRHRLNVPAGKMSCYPDDPGHFVRWLCRHGEPDVSADDFATRYRYGAYLADTFGRAVIAARGSVIVRRLRSRVERCDVTGACARLELSDGATLDADCVVLATGPAAPEAAWVPEALATDERFIADPWAPEALNAALAEERADDVLLVGTGLTAMDLAMSLDRPGRTVHTVSRNGLLPQAHAVAPLPPAPLSPALCGDSLKGMPLAEVRAAVYAYIGRTVRAHGDWRPAVDGLRPVTAGLWSSLTVEERAEFVAHDSSLWNVHRHRMPPATAECVARMARARRLRTYQGSVAAAESRPGGLAVTLADGRSQRELTVGWVVDCTGPGRLSDVLWQGMFADGTAVPDPMRMGVATDNGRLCDAHGRADRPVWTLGAPRRGELWETTAIPELRSQAAAVAEAVFSALTSPHAGARPARRVRRPTDGMGFTLSTGAESAAAYRSGISRLLKVCSGAEDAFVRATTLDPGFALGHAALALMGHETGAEVDVPRALAAAERSARDRADDHERSFVDVVSRRVRGTAAEGDAALVRHLGTYPGDALALAVAVPTIAFSGMHDLEETTALHMVEQTAAAHAGHWFHTSLFAFMRQEQGRYDEAGALAEQALTDEPASGHAMHALAHVHYECGDHEAGRIRLDDWLGSRGRGSTHRAHFSWHAALHELALEDTGAVRRRWAVQLAPAKVRGVRALVDSGSLLWRARVTDSWAGQVPIDDVLGAVSAEILERPATAFTALHAAIALAAADDLAGLSRLHVHALGADTAQREVVAPLCEALVCVVEERWAEAARRLERILPTLRSVGGSAAQREVVEETMLYALVSAGQHTAARLRLEERLARRSSPQDNRRLATLSAA
ncbi:FAD/NAD(P)-binding protein [Streptomyces sp. NBC_01476]|uniref:FAD/NAD(P)-binding protein n=1 Tax=Streptomyces sp. NBC_01476 TaxID=2903881 RepID=UPI002E36DEA1|nr:FAD/NAD(P)-binding protein [Streptomyces sp. NBC_01476]